MPVRPCSYSPKTLVFRVDHLGDPPNTPYPSRFSHLWENHSHLGALAFAPWCIALRCLVRCFRCCKGTTFPLRFSNVLPTFFKEFLCGCHDCHHCQLSLRASEPRRMVTISIYTNCGVFSPLETLNDNHDNDNDDNDNDDNDNGRNVLFYAVYYLHFTSITAHPYTHYPYKLRARA